MLYTITNREGQESLSLVDENTGRVVTVARTHKRWDQIVEALQGEHDNDYLFRLAEPFTEIASRLSEYNDKFDLLGGTIWFDGERIDTRLGDQLIVAVEDEDTEQVARLVRFLENLSENPSFLCRNSVFEWVQRHGMTINDEGMLIGYKGVRPDGTSVHAGPNTYVDGKPCSVGKAAAHIPHEIGTTVSIPRRYVDDSSTACSVGLHVGSYEYASSFGQRLLTVAVNPRDVVSPPSSDLSWKFRTCEYYVLDLAPEEEFETQYLDTYQDDYNALSATVTDAVDSRSTEALGGRQSLTEAVQNPFLVEVLSDESVGHVSAVRVLRDHGVSTSVEEVRAWRKANGVRLTLRARVLG